MPIDNNNAHCGSARFYPHRWLIAGIALSIAGGCTVPPNKQVRTGDNPKHADQDVRFRSTYYFRVFDFCEPHTPTSLTNSKSPDPVFDPGLGNKPYVLQDSFYRFRMTGKADSLTSHVVFESGMLDASDIDPFGASVEFDEDARRFHFVSQQQRSQDIKRNKQFREIDRLIEFRDKLQEKGGVGVSEANAIIADRVKALGIQESDVPAPGTPQSTPMGQSRAVGRELADAANKAAVALKETKTALDEAAAQLRSAGTILNKRGENLDAQANQLHGLATRIDKTAGLRQDANQSLTDAVTATQTAARADIDSAEKQAVSLSVMAQGASAEAEAARGELDVSLDRIKKEIKDWEDEKDKYEQEIGNLASHINTLKETLSDQNSKADKARKAVNKVKDEHAAQLQEVEKLLAKPDEPASKDALPKAVEAEHALRTSMDDKTQAAIALEAKRDNTQTVLSQAETRKGKLVDQVSDLGSKITAATAQNSRMDKLVAAQRAAKTAEDKAKAAHKLVETRLKALQVIKKQLVSSTASTGRGNGGPSAAGCPAGHDVRRGYQIMGPEGWRTFDQDTRLIMAMSSSGRPLIGVLKDISGRVLNQHVSDNDRLMPFARERIAILESQQTLSTTEQTAAEQIVLEALKTFNAGQAQEDNNE